MSTVTFDQMISKLARLQEKQSVRRAHHKRNKKERGHKTPSERKRSEFWKRKCEEREVYHAFQELPFFELSDPSVELSHGNFCLKPVIAPHDRDLFFDTSSHDYDDDDWFAGNEFCEGSFN
ncbi:2b protein [Gayfeather mild mottle virus]|uniref:2b protein n=1 Tax=Gayfeather mild mottle virus TaxID=578305 RepID=C0MNB4_9BROM|nr:2b protein [Gayfeather mild mottle virus]CAT02558.1 2b protein [Gayfeather mild mottle virus]